MKHFDFNSLLNIPFEQWKANGVALSAVSANADGRVNSFLGRARRGPKVYGHRCHEFKDGAFTGKQWFTVEPA